MGTYERKVYQSGTMFQAMTEPKSQGIPPKSIGFYCYLDPRTYAYNTVETVIILLRKGRTGGMRLDSTTVRLAIFDGLVENSKSAEPYTPKIRIEIIDLDEKDLRKMPAHLFVGWAAAKSMFLTFISAYLHTRDLGAKAFKTDLNHLKVWASMTKSSNFKVKKDELLAEYQKEASRMYTINTIRMAEVELARKIMRYHSQVLGIEKTALESQVVQLANIISAESNLDKAATLQLELNDFNAKIQEITKGMVAFDYLIQKMKNRGGL